jgi:pyrroloquinoline quinone biosynthesis protein B
MLRTSDAFAQLSGDTDAPYLMVLGISQDGGTPQAGSNDHPAWTDPSKRRLATSLGLIDPRTGKTWMFDATPDFRQQWFDLDTEARQVGPSAEGSDSTNTLPRRAAPDGIFLTHAHMGHYVGLMFLGHESMGASRVTVYAMKEMADYLSLNGPWEQLVRYENITVRELRHTVPVSLANDLKVIPLLVPHRQEYSEVVGYRIEGPNRSALFIPDIDSWADWDIEGTRIERILQTVDVAYLDGTFFANGEIPGRDMSTFPHPFVTTTMDRLASLPDDQRAKVRFIHLNHTNPAADPTSSEAQQISERGFNVSTRGEKTRL